MLLLLRFFLEVVSDFAWFELAAAFHALLSLDLRRAALFGWMMFFAALSILLCACEKRFFFAVASPADFDEHALRAFFISVLRKDFWLALCSRRVSF